MYTFASREKNGGYRSQAKRGAEVKLSCFPEF
jgi:hypothetical protein